MNKMLNPNGGVPLTLTDLVYMQSATFDAFKSVLNAFSNDTGNVRLAGCVVSWADTSRAAKKVSWTAGYVGLHGEVFPVSAGSLDSVEDGTALYWKITRVQEAQVTLENGQQAARRERSYATLVPESLKDDASVKDNDLKNMAGYIQSTMKGTPEQIMASNPSVDGVILPRIMRTEYPDGLFTYTFAAATSKQVTLPDGVFCDWEARGYFQMIGIIRNLDNNKLSLCTIGLDLDKKVRIYNIGGEEMTTLPNCSIFSY